MKITSVHARQILDSRGWPTVEADVILENGAASGRAAVPSGASTGSHEALELRDGDPKAYGGKGVLKAVANANGEIAQAVIGMDAEDQKTLDEKMIAQDGTPNKSRLGANAILAVSLAAAKAAAAAKNIPLFEHANALARAAGIADDGSGIMGGATLPVPMMNIINGGKHAAGSTDVQEFMIVPVGAPTFADALRMGADVFHALKTVLAGKGYGTTVGDEGGYAPALKGGNAEAFDLIDAAVRAAGYSLGTDIMLALDAAASELWDAPSNTYRLATENRSLTSAEMISWLKMLSGKYPIISIEDGLGEDDWAGWTAMTAEIGAAKQLVGDDLLVTNTEFLSRAIKERAGNAILIKPNQIGTLTETIAAVAMAKAAGWRTIIPHRSGETEDTTIAHLAVGLGTGQIKTGSLSRTERMAKYNYFCHPS